MSAVEKIVAKAADGLAPTDASKAIHDLLLFLGDDYVTSQILDRTAADRISMVNGSDTWLEALIEFIDRSRRSTEGVVGTELAKVLDRVKNNLDQGQNKSTSREPIKHDGRFA